MATSETDDSCSICLDSEFDKLDFAHDTSPQITNKTALYIQAEQNNKTIYHLSCLSTWINTQSPATDPATRREFTSEELIAINFLHNCIDKSLINELKNYYYIERVFFYKKITRCLIYLLFILLCLSTTYLTWIVLLHYYHITPLINFDFDLVISLIFLPLYINYILFEKTLTLTENIARVFASLDYYLVHRIYFIKDGISQSMQRFGIFTSNCESMPSEVPQTIRAILSPQAK